MTDTALPAAVPPGPRLLDAIGRDDLLGHADAHRPHLWRGAAKSSALFGWDDLNHLLSHSRPSPSRLKLVRERRTIPYESWTTPSPGGDEYAAVLPEALHRHLAEGATMVLNAVDDLHPDTEHTAADLDRLFRTVVRANLYASWTATEGFGLHFDDHDVLVVQLSGRKRWRFHPPTRAAAMLQDVVTPPLPTGEPYGDTVLDEGDVVFLPRGWWHGASAGEGTHSMHLTYSIVPITGVDFIRWFTAHLPAEECFRLALPLRDPVTRRDAHVRDMADVLAQMLRRPGLLDQFAATVAARSASRLHVNLPTAVRVEDRPADALPEVLRLSYAQGLVADEGEDGAVLTGAGHVWRLDAACRAALLVLWDGDWHALTEVRRATGEDAWPDVADFLSDLVDKGLASAGPGR
jgi:hypothetical protein